ncbi:MAG: hypothetical protein WA294_09220 [Acidobacteriaceae bacterium]
MRGAKPPIADNRHGILWPMRALRFVLTIVFIPGIAFAQQSIHEVDFRNFSYPLTGSLLGHDGLEWLDTSGPQREIHLVAGSLLKKESGGFLLESVKYADLTGDGKDEAIVVLRYLTGGTQTTNYVYIYTFRDGAPKLLAYCHTGDRAYSGLYRVYATGGTLVFDLYDPAKRSGDCCSNGVIVRRFRWKAGRFEPFGRPEELGVPGEG